MTEVHDKSSIVNQAIQYMLDMIAEKGGNSLNVEALTTTGERVVIQVSVISIEEITQQ